MNVKRPFMLGLILWLLCYFTVTKSYGGIAEDLSEYFDAVGSESLSHGQFLMKRPTKNTEIIHVYSPKWDVEDVGIPSYTGGGLSYVNSKYFVEVLKDIGAATVSYVFMFDLQTAVHCVDKLMLRLKTASQWVNQSNMQPVDSYQNVLYGSLVKQKPKKDGSHD